MIIKKNIKDKFEEYESSSDEDSSVYFTLDEVENDNDNDNDDNRDDRTMNMVKMTITIMLILIMIMFAIQEKSGQYIIVILIDILYIIIYLLVH